MPGFMNLAFFNLRMAERGFWSANVVDEGFNCFCDVGYPQQEFVFDGHLVLLRFLVFYQIGLGITSLQFLQFEESD